MDRASWRRAFFLLFALPGMSFANGEGVPDAMVGECRAVPAAIADHVVPGTVILLGEIHGNRQSPAAFSDIICHAIKADLKVKVGFEFPERYTDAFDSFTREPDSDKALQDLMGLSFWHSESQDGKRSAAMLELMQQIRRWRLDEGANISMFSFDSNGESEGVSRDEAMARHVEEQAGNRRVTLVLTGNYHSRTNPPQEDDDWTKRMGHYLADSGLDVISVNAMIKGGSTWLCRGPNPEDCGVAKGAVPKDWQRRLVRHRGGNQHDYTWWLGPGTASKPANIEYQPVGRLKSRKR